jgi:hypothetical protein
MSVLRGTLLELLFNRMLLEKGLSVTMSSGCSKKLYCERCDKVMAILDDEELLQWLDLKVESGFCFDCDPESAATTPSIFWQWREGDSFTIGGEQFEVWALPGKAAELVQSHAHAHARARGLSSYTKLNRALHNHAVLGQSDTIESSCPRCGLGHGVLVDNGVHCLSCGSENGVVSHIVIPSWLIQEGGNNV